MATYRRPHSADVGPSGIANTANQPMFIHCGAANQLGALWMIKRVLVDQWGLERALVEAMAIGLTRRLTDDFVEDYLAAAPAAALTTPSAYTSCPRRRAA